VAPLAGVPEEDRCGADRHQVGRRVEQNQGMTLDIRRLSPLRRHIEEQRLIYTLVPSPELFVVPMVAPESLYVRAAQFQEHPSQLTYMTPAGIVSANRTSDEVPYGQMEVDSLGVEKRPPCENFP
jgi:hypothetical protein